MKFTNNYTKLQLTKSKFRKAAKNTQEQSG